MADERIRVGFIGCGSISALYTDIYAQLVDVAQRAVQPADPGVSWPGCEISRPMPDVRVPKYSDV